MNNLTGVHSALLQLPVLINNVEARCLLDPGSTSHFLSRRFVEKYGLATQKTDQHIEIQLADGTRQRSREIAQIRVRFGTAASARHVETLVFIVLPLPSCDAIIGMPWLVDRNPVIDWKARTVVVNGVSLPTYSVPTPKTTSVRVSLIQRLNLISIKQVDRAMRHKEIDEMYFIHIKSVDKIESTNTTQQQQQANNVVSTVKSPGKRWNVDNGEALAARLFDDYADVFPDDLPKALPPHRHVDHRIELEAGAQPQMRATYRMSPKELDELKKQLQELGEHGFIRPSKSPFGAPVLFVKKKMVHHVCVLIIVH